MFFEYIIILKYFLVCFLLVLALFVFSFFFVFQRPDPEKFSSYECGFNPFGDARTKFEVRFYLVGILFIIFDLEITFLFPWVIVSLKLLPVGIFSMIFFIIILTIGFIYEWVKGALDWS